MTHRAAADLLIDQQRLSGLLGRPVRVTRLRFKPGLSTTAVLLDAAGEQPPGWVQVSHPGHLDKLHKAVDLAQQRGQALHLLEADGLVIAHGTIDTDPRLQKGLDAVRAAHPSVTAAVAGGRLRVLRYNPQRRLVLREDVPHDHPLVLRVTASRQHEPRSGLRALAAAGVPVVEPLSRQQTVRSRRVTVWPWFGRGDLASLTGGATQPAAATGAALARLHATAAPGHPGAGPATARFAPVPPPVEALTALVTDLTVLDRSAAARMQALVARLCDPLRDDRWETGLTHGDFSADQVLVGGPGEDPVRLTDFDRAGYGPLVADIGTFAAAELLTGPRAADREAAPSSVDRAAAPGPVDRAAVGQAHPAAPDPASLPLTAAVLAAYAEAGGPARHQTDAQSVRLWTARALLTRVLEPFRGADPQWAAGLHRRLDQVNEVLS